MPSIEALWAVKFEGLKGSGHGVVVFENNRLFGGDIAWYYVGDFEVHKKKLKCQIDISFHGEFVESVTGHAAGQTFKIDLHGKISDDGNEIVARGTVVDDPDQVLTFSLKRLAELP